MATDWFSELIGFGERSYHETQKNFEVVGTTLRSTITQRSYVIGKLTTPSSRELRDEAAAAVDGLRGRLKVSNISGDVRSMHGDSAHRHAPFQVGSQFNLLEMTGPDVSPEDGVTRYVHDHTQGSACAVAAAAPLSTGTTSCRWATRSVKRAMSNRLFEGSRRGAGQRDEQALDDAQRLRAVY